ncbi:SdrD B-like domain-containing protein [Fibrella sp. WM1]|uniref:SdrD B-like domain-containing protein n=1 Tax=Fibrella musci TaxID=3242485 RepID=UPI003522C5C5
MNHGLVALARRTLVRLCPRFFSQHTCRVVSVVLLLVCGLGAPRVSAQVSGIVFWDFDRNGMQSTAEPAELGVFNKSVLAYVEGIPQPFTATTGLDGHFAFDASQIASGKRVRLELANQSPYTFDSPGTGSSVQFVQAPNSSILFGLGDPSDYCQADAPLAVPVYQSGALRDAQGMVSFPATVLTTALADNVSPTQITSSNSIGTVWGTAYQRQSQKLFTLGVLKRHAALGPLGLGGIYWANSGNNSTVSYVDAGNFLALASNADKALLAARTLPASVGTTSIDGSVFSMIGKIGFGGATFTPQEDRLWTINLYEKTLVSIYLGTPARPGSQIGAGDFTSYAIPQLDTDKGINRPWAVTYYRGQLYVGVVNDASISRNRNDLKAYVYQFDLATQQFNSTPILTISLAYQKGWTLRGADDPSSLANHWEWWSDNWADYSTNVLNGSSTPQLLRVVRPQPILSSIVFDAEGAMVLGFMDRTGHQTSRNQPSPTESSASPAILYSGYSGGDLLRVAPIGGAYTLEANGSVGSHSGSGVGNGQGPSDGTSSGEFYAWEQYSPPFATITNQETFTGSLLANPNLTNLIASIYNPLTTWSGGASMFDMYNGDLIRRYEIYRDGLSSDPAAPRSTFGSANGVGMICALCDMAPVAIGNRLWVDTNGDGVQDPDEPALAGVRLSLYTADGNWLASTRTNEEGRYTFRSSSSLPLPSNATYLIAVGIDLATQQFDTQNQLLRVGNKAYKLTGWNQGTGDNKTYNDSDAFILTGSSTALNGLPVIQFRLNVPGEVNNSLDAGLQEACDPNATACMPISFRRTR